MKCAARLSCIAVLSVMSILGCTRGITLNQMQAGVSLFSEDVKNQIKQIEKSVVGVNADIVYEIQTFEYQLRNGKLIPDRNSPVKYRLKESGQNGGVVIESDKKTLSGGGVILDYNFDIGVYTILTSSHLVAPEDTVDIHYLDENGSATDVLFQRRIIKNISLSARGPESWRVELELLANDPVDDIAVLTAKTRRSLGPEFQSSLGYDLDLTWGDWVFLFGYPREVKQLTGGWVSESPYRGTFAVDAVVRFGFSGGPVFAVSKDKTELVLVGLIKSVPSGTFDYIAPDGSLPVGYALGQDDMMKLRVQRETVVNYGTAYCVDPKRIRAFLKLVRTPLARVGIELEPKYFGS